LHIRIDFQHYRWVMAENRNKSAI